MGFGSENCTSCFSGFYLVIRLTLPALVRTALYFIWLVSLISVRSHLWREINLEFISYRFLIDVVSWYLHIFFMDLGNFVWTCNKDSAQHHSSYDQGMAVNSFPSYRTCQLWEMKMYFIGRERKNHITVTLYKMMVHLPLEYNAQIWPFIFIGYVKLENVYRPGERMNKDRKLLPYETHRVGL